MNTPSSIDRSRSAELFEAAKGYFPGGVNSPVRAFKSVGGTPLFIAKGNGAQIWDEDNNKFIDFCCSWGPLIHGHNHPYVYEKIMAALQNGASFGAPTRKENELGAFMLERLPFIDKIRFTSSGTEAVMSALRLARGATGKNKILKFEGCYHGHVDALLVKAGSGLVTFGTSSSAGVPEAFANETIVLPLNDEQALSACFEAQHTDLAAVIIEPIPANNGLLLQDMQFLNVLRSLCTKYGVLLIFDEVISGFRVAFGGAAELFGIKPDIVTYGKIIGGGLPVGAYGASKEIMSNVSPEGPVYQAGTLSGNPVAMAAGLAQLELCAAEGFYTQQAKRTQNFVDNINKFALDQDYPMELVCVGSIFWFSFNGKKRILAANQIDSDMSAFNFMHHYLLDVGVYFGPSGYEVGFISSAHTDNQLDYAATQIKAALSAYYQSNP